MAKVKLTHIVGPTMFADKSWTIWHPISTVCKRVWLTWSHILVSVKHFSPTNVCVMDKYFNYPAYTVWLRSNWHTLLAQQCLLTKVEPFDIPSQQCVNVCDWHDHTFWFLSNISAQQMCAWWRSPKLTYHKRANWVAAKLALKKL